MQILRKTIYCDKPQVIFRAVMEDYDEEPIWRGFSTTQKSSLVMVQNNSTKSWTMIEFNSEIACIIAAGDGGELMDIPKEKL